jgi:serine/threonine protein kinase
MATAVDERRSLKRSYLGVDGDFSEFERQVVVAPPPKPRRFEAEDLFAQEDGVVFSLPIVTEMPCVKLDTTSPPHAIGGNGRVYRCTDVDGTDVAVKVFDRLRHDTRTAELVRGRLVFGTKTTYAPVEIELMALKHLHRTTPHPNICAYRAGYALAPDDNSAPEQFAALLDFCPGGSLYSRLARGKPTRPPPNRITLAKQLLSATAYCHRSGFIHADIKPQNILLDERDNVKLSDFGSVLLRQHNAQGMYENLDPSEFVTTTCYRAPEMVLSYLSERIQPHSGSRYEIGCAADVWAIGCTLAEYMLPEQPLFWTHRLEGTNEKQLSKRAENRLLCRQMTKIIGYPTKWPLVGQLLVTYNILPPTKPLAQIPLRTKLQAAALCSKEEIELIAWMLSWRAEQRPNTTTALSVYSRLA